MAKKKEENIPEKELYTTLLSDGYAEFEEKKSIFISHARHIETTEQAIEFVKQIKEKYPDATHNVYAYMVGKSNTRYSDDGEPSGTAGMPVLDIIRKTGFTDAAIVVTRYFGGTLLGTGGLVRAYSESARLAVINAGIATYDDFTEFEISCNYSDYQKISNELEKYSVITDDSIFTDNVLLCLAISESNFEAFAKKIEEITSARASLKAKGKRKELIKG